MTNSSRYAGLKQRHFPTRFSSLGNLWLSLRQVGSRKDFLLNIITNKIMSEIIDPSQQQEIENVEKEKVSDNEWLNDNQEPDIEKPALNAEKVAEQEKTWVETLGERAKEIAAILALVTAFSAGKAAAEEIQAFAVHDSDNDNTEEAQKSRSELLQILESKNQEFLDSLPKNIADLQI